MTEPQQEPAQSDAPTELVYVSDDREFVGYAAIFDGPDNDKDVFAKGAFDKSISVHGPSGIRLLWQHDPREPIGRLLELKVNETGLLVRGRLLRGTLQAREAFALLRYGALDGLSVGFRTTTSETDNETGIRTLLEVDLWEISLATLPTHPLARLCPMGISL